MKALIIAEAGVNHNGSLKEALKLVDEAKKSCADAVKFQTYKTEKLVLNNTSSAPYQIIETGKSSQFKLLKSLELPFKDFEIIKRHCEEVEIEFISTPFDIEALHFLKSIKVKRIKFSSGDLNNFQLLRHAVATNLELILSTGMSTEEEILETSNYLFNQLQASPEKLTFLQCTTAYPTPTDEVNMGQLLRLKEILPCSTGFSDHTKGYYSAMMAVSIGVSTIEKHFTLDKTQQGPDHRASLEPSEFRKYVTKIRLAERIRGQETRKPSKTELENIKHARKGLYFARSLKKGEKIKENDIAVMRPQNGLSPTQFWSVIGKTLQQDVKKHSPIDNQFFK